MGGCHQSRWNTNDFLVEQAADCSRHFNVLINEMLTTICHLPTFSLGSCDHQRSYSTLTLAAISYRPALHGSDVHCAFTYSHTSATRPAARIIF